MINKLTLENCSICNKEVLIPWTIPYEGETKPTAMPLNHVDEDYSDRCICFECADKLCNEGKIMIGYAGFPHSWEAVWVNHSSGETAK